MREPSRLKILEDEYRRVTRLREEQEALYKAALERCNDGVLVQGSDARLYFNERYRKMLGYRDARELAGKPLFHEIDSAYREMVREYMGLGLAGDGNLPACECRLIKKDGTKVEAVISTSPIIYGDAPASLSFIRDITETASAAGQSGHRRERPEDIVKGRTALIEEKKVDLEKEIAERKRAEESLLASEGKYRSIFENAAEGIFRLERESRTLSVNPAMARMCGYDTPDEMTARVTDLFQQIHVDDECRATFATLLGDGKTIDGFEAQIHRKDGTLLWGSLNVWPGKDGAGKVTCYEGTVEDISSRKLAEEDLRQTMERLSTILRGTISAMSMAVEMRDPYTSGHQKKVSSLASFIAREMALPTHTIENVRTAGIVHDIGKMSIPAEILSKPTILSDTEMGLLKIHPRSGYEILKEAELPYPIAEAVLQHHERLDGSGYPQGLRGPEILLEARILAVADVVEALASHRPYRPAFGIDAALDEIEKNIGILYDPQVVSACVTLFRDKGFTLNVLPPQQDSGRSEVPSRAV